jgi:hypothetical protein
MLIFLTSPAPQRVNVLHFHEMEVAQASQDLSRESNDAAVSFAELLVFQLLDAVIAPLPALCRCL